MNIQRESSKFYLFQTLRNFVSDQLVGSSSSCITLCSFKEQASQLCQYLKLAIEQKFPVQGIKTITTNASSNAETNPNPAEAAEKVSVVSNDTVVNTQNDKTSATVVGYTTTVANKVDVNSEAENEVNDNTGNENNLDETKSSNTEITNDNANLPEDVKLDAPQENIKTEEENKVDESNDSKVESPVVGEEPNVNSDDLDETDNYEDSDNSDVVNIDAAAGSHGLPYGDKGRLKNFFHIYNKIDVNLYIDSRIHPIIFFKNKTCSLSLQSHSPIGQYPCGALITFDKHINITQP